ncbi:hypothetical protein FB45DRAFT_911064 [Roridomyces roridus]|uniref:F-box domain-containing protein n=1 Tax=Roridomyces roridus TaxID=1738132 RepID=A0AAD7FSP3_9AGAR|nr:hypothetical protein FB45DRAFT_911064 [Roridomyces roridus]
MSSLTDSPFAQHLNTNYAPSEHEMKWIQSHLVPVSEEIARLDALIQDLAAQRQKAQDYIDAHKALLSPVRRLPQDVMQEIFLACLPAQHNAVFSGREAPQILTAICRGWRNLALSTAALWASLHLPLEFIFDTGEAPEYVKEWIDRSGKVPLSLSIVGARNWEQWEEDYTDPVDELMDTLTGCADRWQSLNLSFLMDEGLGRLGGVDTPRLTDLKMKLVSGEMADLKFLTAPSLRSVTLSIMRDFDRWVPELPFHWENLTFLKFDSAHTYQLQGLSPAVCLSILSRTPGSVHFETDLTSFSQDQAPDTPSPSIVLPALRAFILCRCSSSVGPNTLAYLVQTLDMPELRVLQLSRTGLYLRHSAFLGDLAVHSPLMEELRVDLAGLTHASLTETLSGLSHLKRLVVLDQDRPDTHGAATATLLDFLAPETGTATNMNSSTPCPALTELSIRECRDLPGWDADVLAFARRRLDTPGVVAPIGKLEVEWKYFMPPLQDEVLAPFLARGLRIETTTGASPALASAGMGQEVATPWTGLDELVK